ncbi:hypothetical protein Hanom_Chr16g01502151 [Helianthus anomalus]
MKYLPHRCLGGVFCLRFLQWRVNGDHVEEVVSGFRSHKKESLFPDLNEVVVPSGDYGYGFTDYEYDYGVTSGQENYGNNLSLVMPCTYNKTFVSIHTSKIQWVASNSLTRLEARIDAHHACTKALLMRAIKCDI